MTLRAALILFLGGAALAACGGGDSQPPPDAGPAAGCVTTYSGNFSDSDGAAACVSVSGPADGGASATLDFLLQSKVAGAPTHVSIDLGGPVAAGIYSSETIADWQSTGINTLNCEFSAGSAAVPTGSFTLTLTHDDSDGGPRGTLTVVEYVKAPPTVDCGPGDTETVSVQF